MPSMAKLEKLVYNEYLNKRFFVISREIFIHRMKKRILDNDGDGLRRLGIPTVVKKPFLVGRKKFLLACCCHNSNDPDIQNNKNMARDELLNLRNRNIKLVIIQTACGFWIVTDYINSFASCYRIIEVVPGVLSNSKEFFSERKTITLRASPYLEWYDKPVVPRFLTVYDNGKVHDAESYISEIDWKLNGSFRKRHVSLFDRWLKLYYDHWRSPEINWCIEHRNFGTLVDWTHDDVWLEEMSRVDRPGSTLVKEIVMAINEKDCGYKPEKKIVKPEIKIEEKEEKEEIEENNPFGMIDLS